MPSPEEFGNVSEGHNVASAPRTADGRPDLEALKARARAIRLAQASGAPIPDTGVAMAQPPPPPQTFAPDPYSQPAPTYAQQRANRNDELEQVRVRFKLASYYEALLEQPVFGDDIYSDPYAAQVHSEVTEWATGRMAELAGVRNNPEGFTEEEVALLKSLAQALGSNGVKALVVLADRILTPPPAPPVNLTPTPAPAYMAPPAPLPEPEEDEGSSAMSFVTPPPPPAPVPAPPQVNQSKPRGARVRRVAVPGKPAQSDPIPEAPAKRGPGRPRKIASDPLAAGKAAVAASASPEPANAPAGTPGPSVAPTPQPLPMPRGLAMSMAMEQKAGEALRDAKVIEATGGGVF